jgi:hypothetical protein
MVALDLLTRSPEVIDLLLVTLWFLVDISRNFKGRNFCSDMCVPYPKIQVNFIYGWSWPTFQVTTGHWPTWFSNGTTRYRSSLNMGNLDLHQGHWRSFLFFLSYIIVKSDLQWGDIFFVRKQYPYLLFIRLTMCWRSRVEVSWSVSEVEGRGRSILDVRSRSLKGWR